MRMRTRTAKITITQIEEESKTRGGRRVTTHVSALTYTVMHK